MVIYMENICIKFLDNELYRIGFKIPGNKHETVIQVDESNNLRYFLGRVSDLKEFGMSKIKRDIFDVIKVLSRFYPNSTDDPIYRIIISPKSYIKFDVIE